MNGSETICISVGKNLFNFRVAGVAVQDNKILLHKGETDNFWSLPGGRVEMFEFTKETLLREMMEETGKSVEIGKLIWIAENFYLYNGRKHHEIGFYYQMTFPDPDQQDFVINDGGSQLLFRWHELRDIDSTKIYPDFIKSDLLSDTGTVRHFILDYQDLHVPNVTLS